ncbi:MAG: hypothetical protein Q9217_000897 [Psora testacea]
MTFLTESWFWRGTQSAVFYYLSCAPCSRVAYQRKKRKDAKRAKAEREMAGTFQQPLPSGTNPYWDEEITLGPGPPPKRAAKEKGKNGKKRPKTTDTRESQSGGGQSSASTGAASMDATEGQAVSQNLSRTSGEGWNCRRYQREDEILWGCESVETESIAGLSSLSRPTSGNGRYCYARNPEVNDLHPPVVSTQPISRSEIQWMLQPPPKAKIMAGKERANRSRSGSGTSGGSSLASRCSSRRGGGENLGKQIGERLLEEKKARGEGPLPASPSIAMSRDGSTQSRISSIVSKPAVTKGQRHDRDRDAFSRSSVDSPSPSSAQHQCPSSASVAAISDPFAATSHLARPQLSTMPSTYTNVTQSPQPKTDAQHLRPSPIPADSASSINTLQKVSPPATSSSSEENMRSPPLLDVATTIKLPSATPREELDLQDPLEIDGWQPGDHIPRGSNFPLPTINLHTRHRWSMHA